MSRLNYKLLKEIGRGSYATVYKAVNEAEKQVCAIKKISKAETNKLINEIHIMIELKEKCKNIVSFLTSYSNDSGELFIVMEYCCGGSVKDVMRQLSRNLTEEQITVIIKDVLTALDFLHSETKKMHRDVKAANILLNEEGIAKLGDFGVSEPISQTEKGRSIQGTLLWLPPEVFNQNQSYSCLVDIWSLGITIIEMGDGKPPYSDLASASPQLAQKEIADVSKPSPTFREPSKWSHGLNDFLALCLNKDASSRKSARELLEHDIIKNAPRNDIIKSLVAEVCSKTSDDLEINTSSYQQRSRQKLKEITMLLGKFDERTRRVIRVDQKKPAVELIIREFKMLEEQRLSHDGNYNKLRLESKELEIRKASLEREKKDLESELYAHDNKARELEKKIHQLQSYIHKNSGLTKPFAFK